MGAKIGAKIGVLQTAYDGRMNRQRKTRLQEDGRELWRVARLGAVWWWPLWRLVEGR